LDERDIEQVRHLKRFAAKKKQIPRDHCARGFLVRLAQARELDEFASAASQYPARKRPVSYRQGRTRPPAQLLLGMVENPAFFAPSEGAFLSTAVRDIENGNTKKKPAGTY
jgi:hypothetical protein